MKKIKQVRKNKKDKKGKGIDKQQKRRQEKNNSKRRPLLQKDDSDQHQSDIESSLSDSSYPGLPSDFEDEEIDEEMAFTKEDRKTLGAMMGEEYSSDEEEEEYGKQGQKEGANKKRLGEVDLSEGSEYDDDVQSEDDQDDWMQDALNKRKSYKTDDQQALEEWLSSDSDADADKGHDDTSEDNDMSAQDADDGDGDNDPVATSLVHDVMAGQGGQRKGDRVELQTETVQEGLHNLPAPSTSLTLQDLLSSTPLPSHVASLLAATNKSAATAPPAARHVRERAARRAGYELANADVSKWDDVVDSNRRAATLHFAPKTGSVAGKQGKRGSLGAFAADTHAENQFEKDIQQKLKESGEGDAQADEGEWLVMKELNEADERAKVQQIRRLRSLMTYAAQKAKRIKNIKSKGYHRRQNRAIQRKLGMMQDSDMLLSAEHQQEAIEQAEYNRAKERLTLKHKNSSKWAQRIIQRKLTQSNSSLQQALGNQLRLGEQIRQRVQHVGGGQDSDSAGSDTDDVASDSDVEQGDDEDTAGVSKLLHLPFMKRALEREKIELEEVKEKLRNGEDIGNDEDDYEVDEDDAGAGYDSDEHETAHAKASRLAGAGGPAEPATGTGDDTEQPDVANALRGLDSDDDVALDMSGVEVSGGGSGARVDEVALRNSRAAKKAPFGEEWGTAEAFDAAKQPQRSGGQPQDGEQVEGQIGGEQQKGGGQKRAKRDNEHESAQKRVKYSEASGKVEEVGQEPAVVGDGGEKVGDEALNGPVSKTSKRRQKAKSRKEANKVFNVIIQSGRGFEASRRFIGQRLGYVFKRDKQGLGYYVDRLEVGIWHAELAAELAPKKVTETQSGNAQNGLEAGGNARDAQGLPVVDGGRVDAGEASGAKGHIKGGQVAIGNDASEDEDEGGMAIEAGNGEKSTSNGTVVPNKSPNELTQKELMQMAFAGDDVALQFQQDKEAEVEAELPQSDVLLEMPGWGRWSRSTGVPKWLQNARRKEEQKREKARGARKDAHKELVMIAQGGANKHAQYQASEVPYPYQSQQQYEAALQQPLSRNLTTDRAFRDVIRPAVITNAGTIIEPLQYDRSMAPSEGAKGGKKGGSGGRPKQDNGARGSVSTKVVGGKIVQRVGA